jgi:hypothetical protein
VSRPAEATTSAAGVHPGLRRAIGATVAGLIAAGAALSIAVPARPATAAPAIPARTAWIEGDSVLLGATADTQADLARDGWKATVAPFGGLQLVAAIDVFRKVRPEMGSVAVIELGNNYVGDPDAFGAQIDQAMSVLAGMHVIWLTTALFEPRQSAINAQIWAAGQRWGNLEVLDWSSTVHADPGAVGPDGLHLTTDGRSLMAGLIRQRLDAWYRQYTGPARPVVAAFGGAPGLGPFGQVATAGDAAGIGATPTGRGYWVAGGDGGVLTYGDARFYGSAGSLHLTGPVVGMAATPDGRGYWLVGSDGGILTYGDAGFFGSAGALPLSSPVVGMSATPDGRGYWLVASDGGVFTYGDARFYGSAGSLHLTGPVVGMAATPDGRGYWLVGSDGGILTYGDAGFFGSAAALRLDSPVTAMAAAPDGRGYWLVASDGGLFTFGDARFSGSAVAAPAPMSGASFTDMTARPGGGYWLLGQQPD